MVLIPLLFRVLNAFFDIYCGYHAIPCVDTPFITYGLPEELTILLPLTCSLHYQIQVKP